MPMFCWIVTPRMVAQVETMRTPMKTLEAIELVLKRVTIIGTIRDI